MRSSVRSHTRESGSSTTWKDQWEEEGLIPSGNFLYHGTSLDFAGSSIKMPAWFSQSEKVARRFALRGHVEEGFVLRYRLEGDLHLPEIRGKDELVEFGERFSVDVRGAETMRHTIELAPVPGWVIPYNYPQLGGGDDVLLCQTSKVRFSGRERISEEGSGQRPEA